MLTCVEDSHCAFVELGAFARDCSARQRWFCQRIELGLSHSAHLRFHCRMPCIVSEDGHHAFDVLRVVLVTHNYLLAELLIDALQSLLACIPPMIRQLAMFAFCTRPHQLE